MRIKLKRKAIHVILLCLLLMMPVLYSCTPRPLESLDVYLTLESLSSYRSNSEKYAQQIMSELGASGVYIVVYHPYYEKRRIVASAGDVKGPKEVVPTDTYTQKLFKENVIKGLVLSQPVSSFVEGPEKTILEQNNIIYVSGGGFRDSNDAIKGLIIVRWAKGFNVPGEEEINATLRIYGDYMTQQTVLTENPSLYVY